MPEAIAIQKTPPQVHTSIAFDGQLTKPLLTAGAFYKKVREIRRDPTVRLVRQFAVAPIVAGKWSVEEKDTAPEGAKEFVEKQIDKHRLQLITHAMYGMIDFGWQPFERVIEDTPDGLWGVKWLKPLLQDITSILVDPDDGSYIGLRQEPLSIVSTLSRLSAEINLAADDCLLYSAEVEGTNWYGESVMKSIEKIYDEQFVIQKSATKYDARIAGSHWVIYYPLGTSTYKGTDLDNGAIAQEILRGIEAMGGIALPRSVIQSIDAMNQELSKEESSQWKIELLSDKGSGQTSFLERYKYMDILKVRAFGYPERALLEGQFGTKAEAEAHADLAILNLEMKNEDLVRQTNREFVNWLLAVNWGNEYIDSVYISPAPLANRELAFFREVYKLLIQNRDGFFVESQAVDWKSFRDKLGLPEPSPMLPDMYGEQYDENGNPIASDPIATDPITGMPITDPALFPAPQPLTAIAQFARDMDGKYGDGGKLLESPRDLEHRSAMQKLKQELEGSKQQIAINSRVRKLIVRDVRTAIEAGRRKVAYTHTGEAFDLDGNHVASVVRFPAGTWKEG